MAATKTRAARPRPLTRRPTRAATIATTDAGGSIDRYALSLAAELGIPTLPLEVVEASCETFNISWPSREALRVLHADLEIVRRLRGVRGLLHLPNQHLARYA
jgi:hypothetical protein